MATLSGGSGDDSLTGTAGNDQISGGAGRDTIKGGDGDDVVRGEKGNDTIHADRGNDHLDGGDDADTFVVDRQFGDFGDDTLVGGEGGTDTDTVDLSGMTTPVTVTYTGNEAGTIRDGDGVDTITFSQIERLVLTSGADTVDARASATAGTFDLGGGDDLFRANDAWGVNRAADTISGGAGNDTILSGSGSDLVDGGDGDDVIDGGDFNDTLFGGAGNDRIEAGAEYSQGDDDLIHGGDGDDTVTSSQQDANSNDSLYGDAGNDLIWTRGGSAYLDGGTGDDTLAGAHGDDIIQGGADSDTILVPDDFGKDVVKGGEAGADDDTLDLSALTAPVVVTYSGDEAGSVIQGGNTVSFSEIERLALTGGADSVDASLDRTGVDLDGGAGADSLRGGSGADAIRGGSGEDTLAGGAGHDTLDGGADDDRIAGGAGDDSLTGGAGADSFAFAAGDGADTITDFDLSDDDGDGRFNDQLDVSGLTGGTGPGSTVTARDVTVSHDGNGNALLLFPGGESVVLSGVSPDRIDTVPKLFAAGIPCFAAGTLIETARGPVAVETLRIGDRVRTLDRGDQPVRWIGCRGLDAADLAAHPDLRPILIRKGALGNTRRLRVSPQHGVLVQGRLIRARHLAEILGGTIARIDRAAPGVTYVHFLCDRHEIVLAEGAATESLYPGPMALRALGLSVLADLLRRFPTLAAGLVDLQAAVTVYGPPARPYARRADLGTQRAGTSALALAPAAGAKRPSGARIREPERSGMDSMATVASG